MNSPVLHSLQRGGVVAVVRADDQAQALSAARALIAGGVNAIEITFTVPAAAATIAALAAAASRGDLEGDLLLGAGTVLTTAQAREALAAGAQFLVSPCVVPEVIATARQAGIPCLPGAFTPTEIYSAFSAGAEVIKLFPASQVQPGYIKDIHGPLPQVPLLPTGGIDATNAAAWIKAGAFALGVGGKLVDRTAMRAGKWEVLTARARELMQVVQEARA